MLKWATAEQRRLFEEIEFEYHTFTFYETRIRNFLETQDPSCYLPSHIKKVAQEKKINKWLLKDIKPDPKDPVTKDVTKKSLPTETQIKKYRQREFRVMMFSLGREAGPCGRYLSVDPKTTYRLMEGRQLFRPTISKEEDSEPTFNQKLQDHCITTAK